WLVHHSGRDRVRQSGLWNNRHVDGKYDPLCLVTLEQLLVAERGLNHLCTMLFPAMVPFAAKWTHRNQYPPLANLLEQGHALTLYMAFTPQHPAVSAHHS